MDFGPFFNGIGGSNMCMCYVSPVTPSPAAILNAGSGSGLNTNMITDAFIIIRALFNGASSKLIINNTAPLTANPGTANPGGITLASSVGVGYGGSHSTIEIKEVIIRKVSDSAPNETTIYNYLATKYSI